MPIYNPHNIPCILCGRTDCEHFNIPDDGKLLSRSFRKLLDAGFSPFIYAPYVPLMVTSTYDRPRQEGPQVRRCVSDSGRETFWISGCSGRGAMRQVQNYGAGLIRRYKRDTEGVGVLCEVAWDEGAEVRAVREVRSGGERSGSDSGEEQGR